MLNIIKMDLYKMFKSRSFYIVNVILILIVISMGLLINVASNMDYETAQQGRFSYSTDGNELDTGDTSLAEEEYYAMQEEMKKEMNVREFLSMQYSSALTAILLAIFISIFVCSEWDSGFIKNIIPLKNSRTSLLVSKNIVAVLFIIVQTITAIIGAMISNLIIAGKINIVDSKELMIYIGIHILLRIAFSSLLILISYLFKSKSASMSIGILLSVNIHGLFLTLISKAISISKLDVSKLSIMGNIGIPQYSADDYSRIITISIIYFVLYNIISTIRAKKMEIS